tara:strand:- start:850 stop:1458 length:609 start_codon:yes stop_codon:yes gene_type:complete
MKFIDLNEEILEILEEHRKWFFDQDLSELYVDQKGDSNALYASSREYLDLMLQKPMGKEKGQHAGPPELIRNVYFGVGARSPDKFKKESESFNDKLVKFLGARHSAVHVYYPKDGYMGWHNNWDVPGFNILFNYSNGDGWFHYLEGNEIKKMIDPKGWSAKVGYYGGQDDPFWHCAGGGPRITLGFVIPDQSMWEMMVEDIT